MKIVFISLVALAFANLLPAWSKNLEKQLLIDVTQLSSDVMAGRKPNTPGHKAAQQYIIKQFKQSGLKPLGKGYQQVFNYQKGGRSQPGVNLLGKVEGTQFAEHYIVVSAHYDHLGQRGNRIYYGANDNASGVSTMLALMRHFSKTPAHYSFIFIATDAEEDGLYGAKYFVENPPIALSSITLNINLDMIGDGNRKRRLYIAGTKEYPLLKAFFQPILEQLSSTKVKLVLGHDGFARLKPFSSERINWKRASDHFAFNNKGIAYLYFGTDSNTTYHTPNDRVERIDRAFFIEATTTILKITEALQQLAPEQIKQHN